MVGRFCYIKSFFENISIETQVAKVDAQVAFTGEGQTRASSVHTLTQKFMWGMGERGRCPHVFHARAVGARGPDLPLPAFS